MTLYLLFFGTLLFFGLTRTRAGRAELKRQLEQQFSARFDGSLEIGRLEGNVVYSFLAQDVTLRDPSGSTVAHIDSIWAYPTWAGILKRALEFDRLELLGATVELRRDSTADWNLNRAFQPRRFGADSANTRPPSLVLPRFVVRRTALSITNESKPPDVVADELVFDFLNTEYHIDHARVAMDWMPESKQIDLIDVAGRVGQLGLFVEDGAAQVVVRPGGVDLNDLRISSRGSDIDAIASVRFPTRDDAGGATSQAEVQLKLDAPRLDSRELSAAFPRQPLRQNVGLRLEASGSLDDFVVHNASLAFKESGITASGISSIVNDTVLVDLAVSSDYLAILDLDELLPDRGLGSYYAVDSVAGEVFVQASLPRSEPVASVFTAFVQTELQTAAGGLSATGSLTRTKADIAFEANLAMEDIDASAVTGGRLPPSLLSGSAYGELSTLDLSRATGRIEASMADSWYDGIRLDSLQLQTEAIDGQYDIAATLEQFDSRLDLTGSADLSRGLDQPHVRSRLVTSNADLGHLLKSDSLVTSVSTETTLAVTASSDGMRADATLEVTGGVVDRTGYQVNLPRSYTSAVFQSDTTGSRLELFGDVVRGVMTSSHPLALLRANLPAAADHFRAAFDSALPGPYASIERVTTRRGDDVPDADVSFALDFAQDTTIASIASRRPYHIGAISAEGRFESVAGVTSLTVLAQSDTLATPGRLYSRPRGQIDLTTTTRDSLSAAGLAAGLTGTVAGNAAELQAGQRRIANPEAQIRIDGPALEGSIVATEGESLGPIDIAFRASRNGQSWQTEFDRFLVRASEYSVSVRPDHTVDFFSDAIVARDLLLESPGPTGEEQVLAIDGTWSELPVDTLTVTATRVDLGRLSAFLGSGPRFSGSANGDIDLTRVSGVPALTGHVTVGQFGMDDRILGDVVASSNFRAGTNELDVVATLLPALNVNVDPPRSVVQNDLTVEGSIQFSENSSPSLDLDVDARRADMFFLEYVFPHTISDVSGSLAGDGTIRGTWQKPIFGGRFDISSGFFRVPEFALEMDLAGTVGIDEEAIRIDQAVVTDALSGTAVLQGDILFNEYRFFSLDLSGELSDFQVMNVESSNTLPFYGNIRGSGLLTLTGPISGATLRATDATTNPASEVYIPIVEPLTVSDNSFIVFADSTGALTEPLVDRRSSVLGNRPRTERTFLDGLELDLNLFAPPGSTVHLVIDPLLGDVMNAVGTGRVQIRRREGVFSTFGTLEVNSGDYLFTAGDVFVRQFDIDAGGTITWDGNPTNALLNIPASYATRASRAGLPGSDGTGPAIPLIVKLLITGRVETPEVSLSLEVDRTNRDLSGNYAALEAILNQPTRSAEYATSVLVTNSFLLTTSEARTDVLASSAFNSVSQLVASQINRYLNEALPNVDFSFGVQGESTQELGVTYGIALRLLDERLVIRGEGIYQGARTDASEASSQSLEGEFVVEVRLNPTVSVEVFYRREGDVLTNNATLTGSTGAGVSYRTEFSSWRRFFSRIFGSSRPPAADADTGS